MLNPIDKKEMGSKKDHNRVEVIRAELEATRATFHQTLDAAIQSGWRKKSSSSAWTIGEVLVHLTWALEYLPEEVQRARRGQGMFNIPKLLADALSYWYMRWIARTATPHAIRHRYDQAMNNVIALLDRIPDEDWNLGADFYSEGFHSVEDLFHVPAQHLAEHIR